MSEPLTINVRQIARSLRISIRQVEAVAQLLDEGKTVPFIARYRKDQTGGLEEEHIRRIRARLTQARLLIERKEAILRTIHLQGKLTPELEAQIRAATTARRLEDLYLPYKPKKEGVAAVARARGLEPLAEEILQAAPTCANLEVRAADFVNPDKQVRTPADALLGAGHILAEMISERADLRKKLREVFYNTGRIRAQRLESTPTPPRLAQGTSSPAVASGAAGTPATDHGDGRPALAAEQATGSEKMDSQTAEASLSEQSATSSASFASDGGSESTSLPSAVQLEKAPLQGEKGTEPADCLGEGSASGVETANDSVNVSAGEETSAGGSETDCGDPPQQQGGSGEEQFGSGCSSSAENLAPAESPISEASDAASSEASPGTAGAILEAAPKAEERTGEQQTTTGVGERTLGPGERATPRSGDVASGAASVARPLSKAELRQQQKELKKQRELERRLRAYAEFFDFQESLRKISPHRVLGLNRAERQKMIRVWIECDVAAMKQVLEEECIPPDHPHADFLRGCGEDALRRWIIPSLEREARREMTEKAEVHAVEVFTKSLRKMLLQRPVSGKRILAVDPGVRNGCCIVALDEFGNVLDYGLVYLVGRTHRREEARKKVLEMIRRYRLSLVVIGNGAGSRIVEEFIAELISNELKTEDIRYGVISEIGASIYGTSSVGQEEFPHYDARLRCAISIGRRVLNPLSELVKIDPAHLAVGPYQYDVKAKHLQPLLEEVVESCVNRVGVDVNTAHPWLLRYVSGLNSVLARRLYEHRRANGPFRNRNQLKDVPGFGEGTFELAAGFLKILGGDEPLDRTGIHPESYPLAQRILEKVSAQAQDLWNPATAGAVVKRLSQLDAEALAQELVAGEWTVRQVLGELRRAGREPLDEFPMPQFKRARMKLEDLAPDMELTGTVVHVVDFGAFVDIGLAESGLVHISQMAERYVRDPREIVSVGDSVKVWVIQVDQQRRRISLSMISPDRRAQAAQTPSSQRGSEAPSEKPSSTAPTRPKSPRTPSGRSSTARTERPRKKGPPDSSRREFRSKAPPPPTPKLSEAVKQGKQPMRTFGELLQFFQLARQSAPASTAAPQSSPKEEPAKPSAPNEATQPSSGTEAAISEAALKPTPTTPSVDVPSAADGAEVADPSLAKKQVEDSLVDTTSASTADSPPEPPAASKASDSANSLSPEAPSGSSVSSERSVSSDAPGSISPEQSPPAS